MKLRKIDNSKGSIFDIFILIIALFVIFIFAVVFIFTSNLLNTKLDDIPALNNGVNITQATQDTFGQVDAGLQTLRWITFMIFIALVISLFISSFLVKAHPVFLIIYIFIVVLAIIFSVYISNAYENLLQSAPQLTETFQSFKAMDYVMMNLPIWVTVIGFAGAIFLFMGATIDRQQGGSISI